MASLAQILRNPNKTSMPPMVNYHQVQFLTGSLSSISDQRTANQDGYREGRLHLYVPRRALGVCHGIILTIIIWGIVKIMVPFWVPIIIRDLIWGLI